MVNPQDNDGLRLLDSCICIDWMRKGSPAGEDRASQDSALSAIAVAELLVAGHKHHHAAARRAQVERFISAFPVLPFDALAAEHYADIRAVLEKKGQPIGPMDLLIAAHARSLGATLVTLNGREFKKVPGLKILSP